MFKQHEGIYNPKQIKEILPLAVMGVRWINSNRKHGIPYLDCPVAFDIETTSTYIHDIKRAWMYCWQFGINGYVIIGRTWEEYDEMMAYIKSYLHLEKDTRRLLIFVHNLAYEMSFIQSRYKWHEIFSMDTHHPVKACTVDGFEYRCSYILSGYGLAKIGENLLKYKVEKMVGDLDYDLIRHSSTPLTEKELKYCENDVRVVMAYIAEKIEDDGNIAKILLTKTSYVRKYVRNNTLYKHKSYWGLMRRLTLQTEEYIRAKEAFSGGFTHANPHYVDEILEDVDSIDFTSSYPAVMMAFLYPMSKGWKVQIKSKEMFETYLKRYLSIFEVCFVGLRPKEGVPDNILSLSKCRYTDGTSYKAKDCILNNGRVVIADEPICTTVTNVDFQSLEKFYDWDKFYVKEMWLYKAGYLPKPFLECIIYFYLLKTQLKDVEGKEAEYQWAKGMLNALYGMCVTDICRDEIDFDGKYWETIHNTEKDIETKINDYNNSKSRFLNYLWGVFVTAYARRNLYTGILEFGDDYIYSDTDSIKAKNFSAHTQYVEDYNKWILSMMDKIDKIYGLGNEWISPKDVKGEEHPLGVWDWETKGRPYLQFKTLGAKRYLVKQEAKAKEIEKIEKGGGSLEIFKGRKVVNKMTVAGLPKKAISKLEKLYGDKLFYRFENELHVDAEDTDKNLLTYFDDAEFTETVTDYKGKKSKVHEISYVHMESTDFEFNRDKTFIDYLAGIRRERIN